MFSLPDFHIWLLIVFKSMQDLKLAVWQYLVCHTRSTIQVAYRDFFFLLADDYWCWQLQKAFFFNSSHTFGCHLEVLGSGRIASNNICIPFPFLISVSFSCILKESTYNANPCLLRSYIGSQCWKISVLAYRQSLPTNMTPSSSLLQQILFWGKKREAKEQLHIFCCLVFFIFL